MIRKNTSVLGRKSATSPAQKTENGSAVRHGKFTPQRRSSSITSNSGNKSKYKNLSNARRAGKLTSIAPANDVSKNLRIIPIGGCEEVGRNMTIFEYDGDAIILDMGIQFPEEDMPGIDYIIPNAKYLEHKKKNIRGVVFTHGHLDHIGAAPILLEQLGNPVIVGKDLTLALIKHKQEDYKKGTAKNLKIIRIDKLTDIIKLGKFTIKFFQVEHSIMDAVGVIIETPNGTVIHPGDWTLARDVNGVTQINYDHLSKLPKPTVLMLESLGSTNDKRHGIYEEIYKNK